jgi:hypothetical protein
MVTKSWSIRTTKIYDRRDSRPEDYRVLPIFSVLRALMHDPEDLNLVMLKPVGCNEWVTGYYYLTHPRLQRRPPHPDKSLQVL